VSNKAKMRRLQAEVKYATASAKSNIDEVQRLQRNEQKLIGDVNFLGERVAALHEEKLNLREPLLFVAYHPQAWNTDETERDWKWEAESMRAIALRALEEPRG
jgi:hypothetical protein